VRDSFIVENGGAIYAPRDYFPFDISDSVQRDGYTVIEFGTPYLKLVEALWRLRETHACRLLGFNEMTETEMAADCGLTMAEARRAKRREYDEAFKFIDTEPHKIGAVLLGIEQAGLHYSKGGRYYHLHGDNDKGRAVTLLNSLFKDLDGPIFTIGLGDSPNDLPMLQVVDLPILVKKPDGRYDSVVQNRLPHVRLADGVGPQGWKKAVMEVLSHDLRS
jgi:mannosyl-3-phosphoglycerate phosphatase